MNYSSSRGFSLVELMVTITIIGILSTIVYANFGGARGSGRDAKRQSDVRNLQTAIELYKKQNGKYPDQGCGTAGSTFASESQCATYIKGLAPDFISVLPRDPRRGSSEGYSYLTNAAGTVFKVMAQNTVEGGAVTASNPLRSCDVGTSGLCVPAAAPCRDQDNRFQKSFGAWGGYADGADDAAVRAATALVVCK